MKQLEVVELLDTTHTDTCRVTIHAQDVNDNDPVLSVEGGDEFYIYEKSSETYDNLTVANFTATDKDSGD